MSADETGIGSQFFSMIFLGCTQKFDMAPKRTQKFSWKIRIVAGMWSDAGIGMGRDCQAQSGLGKSEAKIGNEGFDEYVGPDP